MLSDKDKQQQAAVLSEAMETYEEREESRGGLWKQFDARDSSHHMKSKVARIEHAVAGVLHAEENPGVNSEANHDLLTEEAIDSCIDIINYAAFTVRHLRGDL